MWMLLKEMVNVCEKPVGFLEISKMTYSAQNYRGKFLTREQG